MEVSIEKYINSLTYRACKIISENINPETMDRIIEIDLKGHVKNPSRFQKYYFQTLTNRDLFLESAFFREFKSQYSLQGIDNEFLDKLENEKPTILDLIERDELAKLYFDYFAKARIRNKENYKEKALGSFFAKIVHTFRPNDYCALDNPIKKYFGLQGESFFIAFLVISKAYKIWARENPKIIKNIRKEFKRIDSTGFFQHDKMTDLKFLDLVFWIKANRRRL